MAQVMWSGCVAGGPGDEWVCCWWPVLCVVGVLQVAGPLQPVVGVQVPGRGDHRPGRWLQGQSLRPC